MTEKKKYERGPRSQLHIGGGLPPDLLARLDRACDPASNPYAPTKSAMIRRGIELALNELDDLAIQVANELAAARGLKASFGSIAYPADSPEGQIWVEATRIAGILRK